MKALTLTQPWATLVAIGAKKIETRGWKTDYRGPLAIHAAMGFPKWAKDLCVQEPFFSALRAHGLTGMTGVESKDIGPKWFGDLPLGKVLATCVLVDCVRIDFARPSYGRRVERDGSDVDYYMIEYPIPPNDPELSFGDYTPGRYAWVLSQIRALPEPVAVKGALGLWEWPV